MCLLDCVVLIIRRLFLFSLILSNAGISTEYVERFVNKCAAAPSVIFECAKYGAALGTGAGITARLLTNNAAAIGTIGLLAPFVEECTRDAIPLGVTSSLVMRLLQWGWITSITTGVLVPFIAKKWWPEHNSPLAKYSAPIGTFSYGLFSKLTDSNYFASIMGLLTPFLLNRIFNGPDEAKLNEKNGLLDVIDDSIRTEPSSCSENDSRLESNALNRAHVYFDIKRGSNSVLLVGTEYGQESFRVQVPDTHTSFSQYSQNNFSIEPSNNAILFKYRANNSKEVFDLLVNRNGDVEFRDSIETYTGWNEHKTFGIKTSGILKNNGKQAFYSLIASANQIHNSGTIMAGTAQFFQNYFFNSGVLQLGKKPENLVDLASKHTTNTRITPNYKPKTIENCGTLRSNGQFRIKSLDYNEHGCSDFGDFNISGNINIDTNKFMIVEGTASGQVSNLQIGNGGNFLANQLQFPQVQNLNIGQNSLLHSSNTYNITVNNNFTNNGSITSGYDISLHLKRIPRTRQTGFVFARGTFNSNYEIQRKPDNTPDITKDPKSREYLIRHTPDPDSQDFKRLLDEFYKRVKYNPNADNVEENNLPAAIARKIKQIVYTDHYLNTITYHHDSYGRVVDVTETGYIWQRRTQESREFTIHTPEDFDQDLDNKNQFIGAFRNQQNAKTTAAQDLLKYIEAKRMDELKRLFLRQIMAAMYGAKVYDPCVRDILNDPYLRALAHWDRIADDEKNNIISEQPETLNIIEAINDARSWVGDQVRHLGINAQRFVNEIAIPLQAVTEYLPYTALPWFSKMVSNFLPARIIPAMAGSTVLAAGAIVPELVAIGTAMGVTSAVISGVKAYFNENAGGDGNNTGNRNNTSNQRIQSTPQDADRYIDGLNRRGVLSQRKQTKDGYDYFEITRKCEYNGIRFRKGDYISRDTLHHEWEWFRGPKNHKGAIESVGGQLRQRSIDPSRILKIK